MRDEGQGLEFCRYNKGLISGAKVLSMHVIRYQHLREFSIKQSDGDVLDAWFRVASKANWSNFIELQSVFPTAEMVGNLTVFHLKGNQYRLLVSIDYAGQLIYIKSVFTQADDDKEQWQYDASV